MKYNAAVSLKLLSAHRKSDEPLWNLSDMELDDVIEEINSRHFYLQMCPYIKCFNYNVKVGNYYEFN